MKVTRKSQFSGITRTKELDITSEEALLYNSGETNIQHCFPNVSSNDREFILTGITPEEWEEMMKDDETSLNDILPF
jgi:hypothetical protein